MSYTAIISGAGPAGLAAAALLAKDGVKTALVAPAQLPDLRTTALMQPAMQLLKFIGILDDELKSVSAPLKHLQLIDDTENLISAPTINFSAEEMELAEFGWNIPLAKLIPHLRARAEASGVAFIEDRCIKAECHADHITIKTENGVELEAKVLLAADGADSVLRKSLGITVESWNFDQSALTTSFTHSSSHQFISTEYHKSAGPFTTVPLPGNRSSLVWMDRPARIETLLAMSNAELATEIQLETKGSLGRISEVGPRKAFPMRGQRAASFASKRCMILGEAAHVLPPIGAQGLNLSLRDAAHAADLIIGASDPGTDKLLSEYNSLRRTDVLPRQQMVNLLNQSLLSSIPAFALARAAGLAAIKNFAPLRNMAMQQGLGPTANLPFAMRG
jgi:2-octaprenyl-6-methoxyphenol hydroxylase